MDWLEHRQDAIEAKLAARYLAPEANPSRMALFDLSSSWLEGRHCPLAARGYSRDGKKGKLQIEYGLLTDPAGRPVAVRVFPGNTGNTGDPAAFTDPPQQDNPVTPARRSAAAQAKASGQHDPAGRPYRSFRGLLEHLATLTRNQVRFTGTRATVPVLTEPTSTQRQAFDLIGVPIPLTLR
jgi:hypothetical protein